MGLLRLDLYVAACVPRFPRTAERLTESVEELEKCDAGHKLFATSGPSCLEQGFR